jgi:hypothetical protein
VDPAPQFEQPRQSAQEPPAYQPWTGSYQQPPPAARTGPSGGVRAMAIIGIVLGAIALLFLPIVFGPVGIALGAIAYSKGDKAVGLAALIVAAVGLIGGMALGALFWAAT